MTSDSYLKLVSAALRELPVEATERDMSVSIAVADGDEARVLNYVLNSTHGLGSGVMGRITIREPTLDEVVRRVLED